MSSGSTRSAKGEQKSHKQYLHNAKLKQEKKKQLVNAQHCERTKSPTMVIEGERNKLRLQPQK